MTDSENDGRCLRTSLLLPVMGWARLARSGNVRRMAIFQPGRMARLLPATALHLPPCHASPLQVCLPFPQLLCSGSAPCAFSRACSAVHFHQCNHLNLSNSFLSFTSFPMMIFVVGKPSVSTHIFFSICCISTSVSCVSMGLRTWGMRCYGISSCLDF